MRCNRPKQTYSLFSATSSRGPERTLTHSFIRLVALTDAALYTRQGSVVVEFNDGGVLLGCPFVSGVLLSCLVLIVSVLPTFNNLVIGLLVVLFAVRMIPARTNPTPPHMRSSMTANLHITWGTSSWMITTSPFCNVCQKHDEFL